MIVFRSRFLTVALPDPAGRAILAVSGSTADRNAMMEHQKPIASDPAVMMGKPVVAGTRITVESILERLAAGGTVEQVIEAHPRLTREAVQAVQAALAFAADALRHEVGCPVAHQ